MVLALGCSHGEPFAVEDHTPDGFFAAGEPSRLTFGDDVGEPGWLPDGSAIVYAGGALTGVPPDRCLLVIPATGGAIRSEACNAAALADIVDTWAWPAASDDRLAFYYQNSVRGIAPTVAGIYVAPLAAPVVSAPVRSIPFTAPDGMFYIAASHVTWLGANELLFIGYSEQTVMPCPLCDPVRVEYPLALLRGPAEPGAAFTAVPGIAFPTSVVAGATADEIFFTLANDSRVYHRLLSTGAQGVVRDFAGEGIVRDLTYAAGRLAAVVGGKVKVWLEPAGPLQSPDEGGHLHVIELATGTDRRLTDDTRWFRHPAFDPAGTALVGEGRAVHIDQDPESPPNLPVLDTVVTPGGDLWIYGAP
jgi:hypothetical protein